jgi:septal ring factor EnvC (AmiA/AmiB activator)
MCIRDRASCPSNALKISTRAEAQIVSPCDATVVYIGSHLEKSQLVILKRDDYFIVLSGLGSVNCRVGESVIEGEPIGCALSWVANWSINKPQNDFKSEDKVISLQLRKGTQFVDSKPYLRSVPNDKKI